MRYRPRFLSRSVFVMAPVLALLLLSACGGDDDPDSPESTATRLASLVTATPTSGNTEATSTVRPTQAATVTPAPSTSATPGASQTPEPDFEYTGHRIFGDFEYGPRIEFPRHLLMLVETGCAQCDGPTDALYRVWRNDAETHVDLLFDAGLSEHEGATIHSFALRPDLGDIVVGVCTAGSCDALGSQSDPVTVITFYRSTDGGLTWSALLETDLGDVFRVAAVTREGVVLADDEENLSYVGGDDITPPDGAERLDYRSRTAGELLWVSEGGSAVLSNAGRRLAQVSPAGVIDSLAFRKDRGYVVSWHEPGIGQGALVTQPGPDGQLAGFKAVPSLLLVKEIEDGAVLADITLEGDLLGSSIGFVGPLRGIITPVGGALIEAPFGDGERPTGRNTLLAALDGPFFRVTTTETNCRRIYAERQEQSQVLTCAVEGTLLHDLGETVTVAAEVWAHVRLVDGRVGWTDVAFLSTD